MSLNDDRPKVTKITVTPKVSTDDRDIVTSYDLTIAWKIDYNPPSYNTYSVKLIFSTTSDYTLKAPSSITIDEWEWTDLPVSIPFPTKNNCNMTIDFVPISGITLKTTGEYDYK